MTSSNQSDDVIGVKSKAIRKYIPAPSELFIDDVASSDHSMDIGPETREEN